MVTVRPALVNYVNIVTYVLMVLVNGLAGSTTLIGGKFTAEISDANPTLITPAGYVFGIWGIIYLLLAAFVVYQILPQSREAAFQARIGWLFTLSNVLNLMWLFAWQYDQLLVSVVLMFLLLGSLILIYLRLDIGRSKIGWGDRLAVHLPFSVYLGWITIASIANVSVYLVSIGWDGLGLSAETWAILIIIIAIVLASLMMVTRRDIAYAAVIVWAFVGIAVNQSNTTVVTLLYVGVAVVVVVLAASILLANRSRLRSTPA